jgi:AmmeMemoRadiSam system protein A
MTTGTAPLARGLPLALSRPQGAFVTLEKRGELRGCMGDRQGGRPLCQVVGAMALQAAFHDVRFPSLLPRELPEVRIEISLLGEMHPVSDVRSIRLGVDGVLLLKDGHRAVFLPEVAAERGWSREQLLDELCAKAGLGPGSWRRGAEIFTFRTEVLREPEPG